MAGEDCLLDGVEVHGEDLFDVGVDSGEEAEELVVL